VRQPMPYKWLPVVMEEACTGCGLCVAACGPACLETRNLVAVLERPQACGSEEHCVRACPEGAIRMAWLPSAGDTAIGLWRLLSEMEVKRKASRRGGREAEGGGLLIISVLAHRCCFILLELRALSCTEIASIAALLASNWPI